MFGKNITVFLAIGILQFSFIGCGGNIPFLEKASPEPEQRHVINDVQHTNGSGGQGQSIRNEMKFSTKNYKRNASIRVKKTDLDEFMEGKEYVAPDLSQLKKEASTLKKDIETKEESYTLQFASVDDFDVAQFKLYSLQQKVNIPLKLVFQAPFYRIRGGFYDIKEDAEDKILEFKKQNITAFMVKLR